MNTDGIEVIIVCRNEASEPLLTIARDLAIEAVAARGGTDADLAAVAAPSKPKRSAGKTIACYRHGAKS